MKALLKILYFLLFLVIVLLLAGIFLPKKAHVESSVNIYAPGEIVFDQLNDLTNWEKWSPWEAADTTMKIQYGSQIKGSGASYSWTSKRSGSGKISITESIPIKKLAIEIDFGEQGKAESYWKLEPHEKITRLTWVFENSKLNYFERYFMILFRKNMINTFKIGLKKIKEVSEELRLSRISEVKLVNLEKQAAMVIIDSCKLEDMDSLIVNMFTRLKAYVDRRKLITVGKPFTIYYSWNPTGISKFACGIPLEQKTWGWKDYQVIELPEGEAATVIHWGRYDSEKPYNALDHFIQENNLKAKDYIWEVYLNDPENEPDTAMWQKQIYFPILDKE
jgi:effector-binding domain-containing protein